MSRAALVASAAVSAAVVLVVTGLTALSPGAGREYGAPFPVGQSFGISFLPFTPSGIWTFDARLLILDLAITWVTVSIGLRVLGLTSWRWATLGVVLGTLALFGTGLLSWKGLFPYGGFPLPVEGAAGRPAPLLIWVDLLLWALAVPVLVSKLRSARRRPVGSA